VDTDVVPLRFFHKDKGLPHFESAMAAITILSARNGKTVQGC